MYKKHKVDQGTDEWFRARLGLITASNFDKVITPTGKNSSQVTGLVNKAVAEILTGEPIDSYTSQAMERGKDLESDAFNFLSFAHGFNFEKVGLIEAVNNVGESLGYGCSPDGFCESEKIGLELKCPLAHTHVAYLRSGVLPSEYLLQVQGSMLVTGFDKWIFCSYHPLMQSLVVEVERDEEIIEKLRSGLNSAVLEVSKCLMKFGGGER